MNPVEGRSPRLLAHRYEVGQLLGRGGMASVHLGLDTRLGRKVAIKMLRADLARDPSFHARFRREAQSAAALNHPSIVAVYDTGEDVQVGPGGVEEQTPFIVMEYVEGRTLREILRSDEGATAHLAGGPDVATQVSRPPSGYDTGGQETVRALEIGEAVKMTVGVLSALEYSHRAGIVHRDIKPANVMVTRNGDIKVMDFGIARAVADSSATMTQTHAVIGTAQYLSPEQARGEQVDARSDLYSAGCLLYELLTGRPPFVGDSPVSVAYQHVRELPQPPSVLNPEVPEALDRVVLLALAKDREARYADAHAFRTDLQAAVAGRAVHAPPVSAAATQAMGATGSWDDDYDDYERTGTDTFDRVDDPRDQPRRRTGAYVMLALAAVAVFALVAFGVSQLLGNETETTEVAVPNVVELDRASAKSAIEARDLTYVETGEVNHDTIPAGSIVSQNPTADTSVEAGTAVNVEVSLGPAEVTVPTLVGSAQAAAQEQLEQAGLTLGEVTTEDDPEAARGTVIRSSPDAGQQVAKNSAVNLVLSSGQVALPDLKGQTTAEARRILLELGLEIEVSYGDSEETPDTVIDQQPAPGKVAQGSTVQVLAAKAGPSTPTPTGTPTTPGPTSPPPTSPPPDDED